jgi:predicted transcriptional regulator
MGIIAYTGEIIVKGGRRVNLDNILRALYGLSDTDLKVLRIIETLGKAKIDEISRKMNVNKSTVIKSLKTLHSLGFIQREILRNGNKGRPTFIYFINIKIEYKIKEDLESIVSALSKT